MRRRVLEEETLLSQSEPQEGKKDPKEAFSMSSMTPFGGFLRGVQAIGFGAF